MALAQDIVQALIERAAPRVPVERRTGMPYGWAAWLGAQPPLPATARASPADLVALLAQQPPSPPPRGEDLAIWPAFLALFRADWLPAPPDQRRWRSVARVGSLVLHLLFVAFLAWVAWIQSLYVPTAPEEAGGGERIAVGFVGAGDPGTPQVDAEGGAGGEVGAAAMAAGPAATAIDAVQADPRMSPPVQGEAVPVPSSTPPPAQAVAQEQPAATPESSAADQPVQVTEVEQPRIDYVLPPTTPRAIELPVPSDQRLREREVVVVQTPQVRLPPPRPVDLAVVPPRDVQMQVRARAVDEPLPTVQVPATAVAVPHVQPRLPGVPEASLRQREVTMPSPSSAGADATAAAATTTAREGDRAHDRAPPSGQAATAAGPSTPASRPAPGSGWNSPIAGDDWGQARNGEQRPGGAPGLLDGQGRVRLPGEGAGSAPAQGSGAGGGPAGAGVAGRGAPGGDSDSWSRERLERSGTWLKRPPYDFEPTSFDRYWVPNESLLAEWVRKGMKTVAIPIPGTGKKINCVVSLLQLGGGCGIVDPDLNEQPADGRASPDIPFKPGLQEDNGSVRPL